MAGKKYGFNDMASRLKELRRVFGGGVTQKAFAEMLEIDQQRLSSYEKGTRVPHQVLAKLVEMGVNPYWLLLGEGAIFRESEEAEAIRHLELSVAEPAADYAVSSGKRHKSKNDLSDFYVLPLYADEAAAGEPLEMRDTEIEGPAIIHRNWCPHPETTDYVRIAQTGTSMEPTIPAGAIVTIDRSECNPDELIGAIVAIGLRDNGVTVKRLQQTARQGYIGVPDNPDPEHRTIFLEEGDRIIGKITTIHAWLG